MLKSTLDTIRALLLGLVVAAVFFAGLTTGTQLGRVPRAHTDRTPTPDLAATISALEARVEELLRGTPARSGAETAPTPARLTPSATPTLRVVTRATVEGTWGSVERDRAVEIAREYVGGGEVVQVQQERKYGTVVLEVEFRHGSEVYVDMQSGRVLYAEVNPADRAPTSTPVPPPTPTPPPTATTAPTPVPPTPTPEPPPPPADNDQGEEEGDSQGQESAPPAGDDRDEGAEASPPPPPAPPPDDREDEEDDGQRDDGEDHDDEPDDEDEDENDDDD